MIRSENGQKRPTQLNDSIEALVQRVSPCVVQIVVSGYGSTDEIDRGQTSVVIGRQRAIGSGVIDVDPEGYIVTNAQVSPNFGINVVGQRKHPGECECSRPNYAPAPSFQNKMAGVKNEKTKKS